MRRTLPRFLMPVLLAATFAACDGLDAGSAPDAPTAALASKDAPPQAMLPAPGARVMPVPESPRLSSSGAAGKPIPGRYIVVLKDGVAALGDGPGVAAIARRLVDAPGRGRVLRSYAHALRGFAADNMTDAQANALRALPEVDYVEQDQEVTITATQSSAPWGLDRTDQPSLPLSTTYTYNQTGAGVTAYIIDTGIRLTHGQFGGRATSGYDAIDGGSADDCNGHGTHVAGSVGGSTYGIAKSVSLVAVRVLDCAGSGSNAGMIAGVDWVTANARKPAVANMSLGGGASTALDDAVARSIASGITYAVAAGNDNVNACNASPARTPNALTVGSTTSTDARSSFSNYGSCLDLFAPGSSIISAWYTSNTATNTISGTSMASPHVAGVVALYLQTNPSATPAEVASAITGAAVASKVTNAGTGSPNRLLQLVGGGTTTPPPTGAPCTGCTAYTGSLSAGGSAIQPNGTYYQSTVSGTHAGFLRGPSSADFDLYLYKWNGASWTRVASKTGSTSNEDLNYSGTAGYYYWQIVSYSGSGTYTFYLTKP